MSIMLQDLNISQSSINSSENINENYETYRKESEAKIEGLKDILRKAKITIDRQKIDIANKNEAIENQNQKVLQLEQTIQKYLEDEKKQIDLKNVVKVLSKVNVDGVSWLCLKSPHSIDWIREEEYESALSTCQNELKEQILPISINLNEFLSMKETIQKLQKQVEGDVQNVIAQYEERMKRLSKENEVLQQKIKELNNVLVENKACYEDELAQIIERMKEIIDQSEEARENSLGYMAEENEESVKKECLNRMKLYLIRMAKLGSTQKESEELTALKEHIILLHSTLFDVLKKFQNSVADALKIENDAEEKYKALLKVKDAEKTEKEEILSQGRKMIKDLQKQLAELKTEHAKQIKERDMKIEFMQQEMKKNVNIQYIKNILIKFFNSDFSVKERTLPVIQTVLQFTPSESESLTNAWMKDQGPVRSTMSHIGKMFSFSSNS